MDTGETARRERERSAPFGTTMAVARRTASGRLLPAAFEAALVPYRREAVAAVRSSGGLLTDPTPAA